VTRLCWRVCRLRRTRWRVARLAAKSTFGRKSKPFYRNSGSPKVVRRANAGGPVFKGAAAVVPVLRWGGGAFPTVS